MSRKRTRRRHAKRGRLGCRLTALLPLLVLLAFNASGSEPSPAFVARMTHAIYVAESGSKTSYPYGVKSIKTTSVEHARRITETSIRRGWQRWEAAGKPEAFIPFFAKRWCPPSVDPVGYRNWTNNVTKLMKGKL